MEGVELDMRLYLGLSKHSTGAAVADFNRVDRKYWFVHRYLCERVVPGNRITAIGVYSIKKQGTGRSRVLLRNTLGVACILSHQYDMGTCVLSYKKTYNVISGPS